MGDEKAKGEEPCRFLLIGAGKMGYAYAQVLKSFYEQRVALVCNRQESAENFGKAFEFDAYHGGYERFFVEHREDVLSNVTHIVVAIDEEKLLPCLGDIVRFYREKKGAGKEGGAPSVCCLRRVLVEKPVCLDPLRLETFIQNNEDVLKDLEVYVAYNRRYYDVVTRLKEGFEKDGLRPETMTFDFCDWEDRIKNVEKPKEIMDEWFTVNACHVVDTAFYLCGYPEELSVQQGGHGTWRNARKGRASTFSGSGKTKEGVTFGYSSNWNMQGSWKIEISGSPGFRYLINPMEKGKITFYQSGKVSGEEETSERTGFKPGLLPMTKDFVLNKAMRLPDLRENLRLLRVLKEMEGEAVPPSEGESKKRVLLVGGGQIGSRHAQSLASTFDCLRRDKDDHTCDCKDGDRCCVSELHVVEVFRTSFDTLASRFEEKGGNSSRLHYHDSVSGCKDLRFDVVIVATCSDVRRQVAEQTLKTCRGVKHMILEKPVFLEPRDFEEVSALAEQFGAKLWTNIGTTLKDMEVFKEVRQRSSEFEEGSKGSPPSLKLSCKGVNWGLCCNVTHLLELLRFVSNDSCEVVKMSLDASKVHESKRPGFYEVFGTLYGYDREGRTVFEASCEGGEDSEVWKEIRVATLEGDEEWLCYHERNHTVIKNGGQTTSKEVQRMVSQLTGDIVRELLTREAGEGKGFSGLPSLEACAKYHVPLLKTLEPIFKANNVNGVLIS